LLSLFFCNSFSFDFIGFLFCNPFRLGFLSSKLLSEFGFSFSLGLVFGNFLGFNFFSKDSFSFHLFLSNSNLFSLYLSNLLLLSLFFSNSFLLMLLLCCLLDSKYLLLLNCYFLFDSCLSLFFLLLFFFLSLYLYQFKLSSKSLLSVLFGLLLGNGSFFICFILCNFLFDSKLCCFLIFLFLFSSLSHDSIPLSLEFCFFISFLTSDFSKSLCFFLSPLHSSKFGIFSVNFILFFLSNSGLFSSLNS
jgi:hypothetical protein